MKVLVYHRSYGCDTGCCGYAVELANDEENDEEFDFDHPYGMDGREFAEKLVRQYFGEEHVKDLD